MSRTIEVKQIPALSVVGALSTVRIEGIGPALGRILPATFAWLEARGVRPASAPMSLYYGCRGNPREFVMMGGMAVNDSDLVTLFGGALDQCRLPDVSAHPEGAFGVAMPHSSHDDAPRSPVGAFVFSQIPACEVVSCLHRGHYSELAEVHRSVSDWFTENGRATGWPSWEVYLNDCSELSDPADWLTEVVWPIA